MAWLNVVFITAVISTYNGGLCMQCLSQTGSPVDWFVIYKIPRIKNQTPTIQGGTAFYYMDNEDPSLDLSEAGIDDVNGNAVYYTLNQMYKNRTSIAYAMYNDHPPDERSNQRGHTKGIVALDKAGGFWMVHSTPEFPPPWSQGYQWPKNGLINGQTFLCISMTYRNMNEIGNVFMYTYPYIYDSSLPDAFVQDLPLLARIIRKKQHVTSEPWNKDIELTTKDNVVFHSYAKFTKFNRDLYDGFLSYEMKDDLLVQSWIESTKKPENKLPSNCSIPFKVYNVKMIQFPGTDIKFQTAKDHSKWAVSKQNGNWLCIGDINRQKPQFKRGGAQVCFQHPQAWKSLRALVTDDSFEKC